MNHDNAKIEEIIQKIPNEMPFHEFVVEAMKEYAEYYLKERLKEEKAFIINMLNAIDRADEEMGLFPTTNTIRLTLNSRATWALLDDESITNTQ